MISYAFGVLNLTDANVTSNEGNVFVVANWDMQKFTNKV